MKSLAPEEPMPCGFPRRRRSAFIVTAFLAAWLVAVTGEILAAAPEPERRPAAQPRSSEIIVQGKLFCSLKRQVIVPFRAIITSVKVRAGLRVKEGEVLARYRLPSDVAQLLRKRLTAPQISELEVQLADVERNLATLENKHAEIRQLAAQNMASAQSLTQAERDIGLLTKHRSALQERLKLERQLTNDDTASLKEMLGGTVKSLQANGEASLLAPIAGHVIGMQSDLRDGAEMGAGTPAVVIGVMNPMVMRIQVHESEAVQLTLGDQAEVTFESIPDRKFEGMVSRLSWAPMTPGIEQPSYYELELTVPNPDLLLREGLKGQVVFPKSR